MSQSLKALRHLDQCIYDRDSLGVLKRTIDKVEKCCAVVDEGMNIADVVEDAENFRSLMNLFGTDHFDIGVQLILKASLSEYRSKTFTVKNSIEGEKKINFLYSSLGGWKQFSIVLSILLLAEESVEEGARKMVLVNPQRKDHWSRFKVIPQGSLVSIYIKSTTGDKSISQEDLAIDRIKAIFNVVQIRNNFRDDSPTPAVQVRNGKSEKAGEKSTPIASISRIHSRNGASHSSKLAMSFQVTINKIDTFVHAGNAQLIIRHLLEYSGRVELYVLRGEKQKVQLDADSIWSAEIRNGETVVFDFFGPAPGEEFLKELAVKVNKYTQMDKIANQ